MLQGYLGNWSLESPVGADSHLQSDARVANCSLCGCSLNQNKEIAQVMNLVCWYDNLRTPLKMFYTSSIKDIKALLHLLLSQNRTRKSDCKGILSNQTCCNSLRINEVHLVHFSFYKLCNCLSHQMANC